MHHGSMTVWMRTLSLPRYFLATAIGGYLLAVGIGNSLTLLLDPRVGWTRSSLAFSAVLALAVASPSTSKERARRRRVVQG